MEGAETRHSPPKAKSYGDGIVLPSKELEKVVTVRSEVRVLSEA